MPNKSQPDTFLMNKMSGKTPMHGTENNKYLLEWYAALDTRDETLCRKRAKLFLIEVAGKLTMEMGFSDTQKNNIVNMFEPLDKLFVSALSLGKEGEHIREHLSHTIRNYLFSQYVLSKLNDVSEYNQKLLGLATIFHDLAYPIEKFKKAASGLKHAFFEDYLDTKGKMEVELKETDNLLAVLDFVGSHDLKDFEYLYRWVVAPAIAGIGLFDSSHNISSTSLFIRSTLDKWGSNATFWKEKERDLATICMAITFHDRKMNPLSLPEGVTFSTVAKALRIADELQEWGRDEDENSDVSGVTIDESLPSDTFLSLTITLKNKTDIKKCDPARFMADKISGLLPTIGNGEKLLLRLEFPDNAERPTLENIVKAYERYALKAFLNEPTGMTMHDINKKSKSTYTDKNSLIAMFSNHEVTLA